MCSPNAPCPACGMRHTVEPAGNEVLPCVRAVSIITSYCAPGHPTSAGGIGGVIGVRLPVLVALLLHDALIAELAPAVSHSDC
jgi:hypothetical protein